MSVFSAAEDGDLEALRDRIARGDDVDEEDEDGDTPLIWACNLGHHECARALIEAGAAVDKVSCCGRTPLMTAFVYGHHEIVQALIDAGAAMDVVTNDGGTALTELCDYGLHKHARAWIVACATADRNALDTALMKAIESPSLDDILDQAVLDAESDVEYDSDVFFEDSDLDEDELEQRNEERFQRRSERRLEKRCQGRACCVQALLEAMAPIRGADFADRAASFKFACERLRVLEKVLAASHVIAHASSGQVKARVVTLTADAQGIVTDFVRAVLASWYGVA